MDHVTGAPVSGPSILARLPRSEKGAKGRTEAIPLLLDKFRGNIAGRFSPAAHEKILATSLEQERLEAMPVSEYMDLYAL